MEATDFRDPDKVLEHLPAVDKLNLEVHIVGQDGRPIWGRRICI